MHPVVGLGAFARPALLAIGLASCAAPGPSTLPSGIAVGPDGTLWFTQGAVGKIGRMTTDFVSSSDVPIPIAASYPDDVAKGPDGAMWFTDIGTSAIGRIDAAGHVIE